jgi:Lrp/AsnC family transcriptional regulator, leucine-responsive regulatory protein
MANNMRFDRTDVRILDVLQQDAALENQELARRVHLSPAACLRRVRRLRDAGFISQVVALVDAAKVGLHVQAYAFVRLESHHPGSLSQFETMVRNRREVMECVRLSGGYDFLIHIAVESMTSYSAFLDTHLLPLPAIRSVNTTFELGVLKRTTALPVGNAASHETREQLRP